MVEEIYIVFYRTLQVLVLHSEIKLHISIFPQIVYSLLPDFEPPSDLNLLCVVHESVYQLLLLVISIFGGDQGMDVLGRFLIFQKPCP